MPLGYHARKGIHIGTPLCLACVPIGYRPRDGSHIDTPALARILRAMVLMG